MLKTKKHLRQLTGLVDDELKLHKYASVIKQVVSIYEYTFRVLYKRYLGELQDPEPIVMYVKSNKLGMFGTWLGFISKTNFLDEIYSIINKDKKFTDKTSFVKHLNEINAIRISETHIDESGSFDNLSISKELANEAQNALIKFLKLYSLYDLEHISAKTAYATVSVQKLLGETQFYESLYEVLSEEEITNLDVTYFSSKLPQVSKDEIVNEYWNLVNKKISEKKLNLRRILSIDEYDKKGLKLLWILFNMVPKVYRSLNDNVSVSIFKTSASFLNEEVYEAKEVNLLNIILMYNKKNPDKGHLWVFSGHQNDTQEQEYAHIYGRDNIVLYQKIYTNLLNSSIPLNDDTIKALLNSRADNIDSKSIDPFVDKIMKIKDKIQILDSDVVSIKDVYKEIFSDQKKDDDDIW